MLLHIVFNLLQYFFLNNDKNLIKFIICMTILKDWLQCKYLWGQGGIMGSTLVSHHSGPSFDSWPDMKWEY